MAELYEEPLTEEPTTRENILDQEDLLEENEDTQNEEELEEGQIMSSQNENTSEEPPVSDSGSSSASATEAQKEPKTLTPLGDKTTVNTITPRRSSRTIKPPAVYDNSFTVTPKPRTSRKRSVSEDKENTPGPANRKKMKVENDDSRKGKKNKENDNSRKGKKNKSNKIKPAQLREMIKNLGGPKRSGNCVRTGIARGYIKITGNRLSDLKVVVKRDKLDCGHEVDATVRKLLFQPDIGGWDEELEKVVIRCDRGCPEGRTYVTGMCYGDPQFTYGDDHNHCNVCPDYGQCIGDYREAHCRKCGNHYHKGGPLNFPCYHCGNNASMRTGPRGTGNQYVWM